jgi:hypothetical protein
MSKRLNPSQKAKELAEENVKVMWNQEANDVVVLLQQSLIT